MARIFLPSAMILVVGSMYPTVIRDPADQSMVNADTDRAFNGTPGSISVVACPSDGNERFWDGAKVILTLSRSRVCATAILRNNSHICLGLVNTMTKVSASIWPGRLDEWYPTGGEG